MTSSIIQSNLPDALFHFSEVGFVVPWFDVENDVGFGDEDGLRRLLSLVGSEALSLCI